MLEEMSYSGDKGERESIREVKVGVPKSLLPPGLLKWSDTVVARSSKCPSTDHIPTLPVRHLAMVCRKKGKSYNLVRE